MATRRGKIYICNGCGEEAPERVKYRDCCKIKEPPRDWETILRGEYTLCPKCAREFHDFERFCEQRRMEEDAQKLCEDPVVDE